MQRAHTHAEDEEFRGLMAALRVIGVNQGHIDYWVENWDNNPGWNCNVFRWWVDGTVSIPSNLLKDAQ
jgi:hypothetical protein